MGAEKVKKVLARAGKAHHEVKVKQRGFDVKESGRGRTIWFAHLV